MQTTIHTCALVTSTYPTNDPTSRTAPTKASIGREVSWPLSAGCVQLPADFAETSSDEASCTLEGRTHQHPHAHTHTKAQTHAPHPKNPPNAGATSGTAVGGAWMMDAFTMKPVDDVPFGWCYVLACFSGWLFQCSNVPPWVLWVELGLPSSF